MMTINSNNDLAHNAWCKFQEIKKVVEKRYLKNEKVDSVVADALTRLQEAVLCRYKLNPESYLISRKFTLVLKIEEEMDLSSEEKMLNTRFCQWQEGIREGCGGYVEQLSLQETMDKPFSELKLIVSITFDQVKLLFSQMQVNVGKELERLRQKGNASDKIEQITSSMNFLEAAIHHKFAISNRSSTVLSDDQKKFLDSIDLYSYETLLDAKVGAWSVRQALNLSTDNWMSRYFGLQESWWGRAKALENFEANLTRIHDKS